MAETWDVAEFGIYRLFGVPTFVHQIKTKKKKNKFKKLKIG
jgi:hypothetical protein